MNRMDRTKDTRSDGGSLQSYAVLSEGRSRSPDLSSGNIGACPQIRYWLPHNGPAGRWFYCTCDSVFEIREQHQ